MEIYQSGRSSTMTNNSTTLYEYYYDFDDVEHSCDDPMDFSTISAAFFIVIFIISITGNSLLLFVLVRRGNLKNATNLFILNLTCSNLVFAVNLPFWAVELLHHWVFGDLGCKLLSAADFVGFYSSVILLTAVTVDHFITVVLNKWPSKLVRVRCAAGFCATAWIISIVASLHIAIKMKETTNEDVKEEVEPEPENPNQFVYESTHSKTIIVYKENFVPYTTRIYNFVKSFSSGPESGGSEK
ncbi:chemokine XC receptor 1-like [Scomber scombrus]|uniref:Chemokine XC receptor 1-like n=1 Tax=Scomber scombrus TaxID=13677 RepID=A0AAV1PBQ4_SCOSC